LTTPPAANAAVLNNVATIASIFNWIGCIGVSPRAYICK
jgi:hypothetical protein